MRGRREETRDAGETLTRGTRLLREYLYRNVGIDCRFFSLKEIRPRHREGGYMRKVCIAVNQISDRVRALVPAGRERRGLCYVGAGRTTQIKWSPLGDWGDAEPCEQKKIEKKS